MIRGKIIRTLFCAVLRTTFVHNDTTQTWAALGGRL